MCGQTTPFIYDGDGNLVKKIKPDNSKTIYVGRIYEVDKTSGGSVTQTRTYYPAGGAMRIDGTLYYILKDHLGSASVISNASGVTVSGGEQRYYPFGESRLTATMLTDRLFTGQREMAGLGIYHYKARFYSPKLGRFLSPDTIVPSYANPQSWNRYSYVGNNPLRYTDPTGHMQAEDRFTSSNGTCNADDKSCNWVGKSKKPKREKTLPDHLSDIALGADIASMVISKGEQWAANGIYAIMAIGCLGGPELCAATMGTGFQADMAIAVLAGPLENSLGVASFLATAASDALRGDTTISSNGVYIGRDTLVSARNTAIGFVPESNLDAWVSVSQVEYDQARMDGSKAGGSIAISNIGEVVMQVIWQDTFVKDAWENIFK